MKCRPSAVRLLVYGDEVTIIMIITIIIILLLLLIYFYLASQRRIRRHSVALHTEANVKS